MFRLDSAMASMRVNLLRATNAFDNAFDNKAEETDRCRKAAQSFQKKVARQLLLFGKGLGPAALATLRLPVADVKRLVRKSVCFSETISISQEQVSSLMAWSWF